MKSEMKAVLSRTRIIMRAFCLSALCLLAVEASAGVPVFTYTNNSSTTITITGYSGSGGMSIPDTIDGYVVAAIGEHAFAGNTNITGGVAISTNVTAIGHSAFAGCSLTGVTIPDSVTSIGYSAFLECDRLISVTIPDKVGNISDFTFEGCASLTGVTIGSGVTSIGLQAFYECTKLTGVTIPGNVSSIGQNAFGLCTKLASVTIGNGVVSIGAGAFAYTSLTGVTIPDSVTGIGGNSFSFCTNLTSVTIGNGVTSIGDQAFGWCSKLISVVIPDSVTSIGSQAFRDCYKLDDVTIGANVTGIGEAAFVSCTSLIDITIPDSVITIGDYAFQSCTNLDSITISDSVTSIGNGVFFDCANLTIVTMPNYIANIGENAFKRCISLTDIIIPDLVTNIGNGAFDGCAKLTDVIIPDGVTQIGARSFFDCAGLTSITIPDSVTDIGANAFQNCTGLITVIIGSDVASIGDYAFESCTNLTGVYFRGNAPSLGENVFQNDTKAIMYYLKGAAGWPTVPNQWAGRPTALWVIDILKPTVAIKAPTALLRILGTNGLFAVSGTALDNKAVASVWVRLNSNGWTKATGTNVWSLPVTLIPGTNTIRAYSMDTSKNHSLTSIVTCVYAVTGALTIQTNGLGAVTRSPTGIPEVGKLYTLTAVPPKIGSAFSRWSGDAAGTNKVLSFIMTSNMTITANFIDNLRPTVAITAPTASLRILGTNGLFTVRGTAADNKAVAAVKVKLNGDGWTDASGTNIWSLPVTLIPGTNIVRAYSVDTTGNNSLTSSVTCVYVVTGALTIQTNGLGTVTRLPTGVPEVGKSYTLTAVPPKIGSAFSRWSGDAAGTNKVLAFTMTSNMMITANFIDNLRPTVAITAPIAAQRVVTDGLFTVRGSAADNLSLSNVLVQLNGGSWTAAETTNGLKNWSLPVTLIPGTNTIRAYSVDTTGNNSLTSSVVCTYVVGGNLTIQTNGPGTVARSPTGAPEVGMTYTLMATPGVGSAFSSWTGDLTGTNKVLSFSMSSNLTIAANFTDVQNPTVTITAPTASLRISNAVYTVKGTAADNGTLTNVLCRMNSGAWTNATTTNSWKNWSVQVVLEEGSNLVQACSVDSGGNVSSFANVSCTYVVTAQMTVQRTGPGTVSPDLNGQALEIGRNYTMTAVPGAGSVFINWTCGVGGEVATNKPVVTFGMQSNLVLTANFINLPDLSEDGLLALSGFLNTNSISYGDAMKIADAADAFGLAVQGYPNNYTNRIYNAVAIMLNLINDSAVRNQAEAYGLDLDNLFDPMTGAFPTNAPAVDASVDNFAAAVLPAIDKAWTNLNVIPATWTGRIEISTNRFPVDESVWVDAGDVTAMKAALKGLRAFVGLLKAYNLNVDYNRFVDPVATPQKTITVNGSIADWTNVPRSLVTFNYPDGTGSKATVTQEVAVALDGTNIALLVTGCPFGTTNAFLIWFDLLLSNGGGINSNRSSTVNLQSDGSVIYGLVSGAPVVGLEAALSGGVLEVKLPVPDGQETSQVTLEEVGCGLNIGGPGGYWEDVFSVTSPEDTPISILRANHPEFLSKVRNPTSLAGAKTDLTAALSGYLSADTLIGKRSGDNAGLLHLVDFDPADPLATENRLEMKAYVTQILASLTAAVQMPGDEDIEGTATRPVFLGAFFKAPYITTNLLPSGLKGTRNNPGWNVFPDPTLNGILPGMTSTYLTKYLLGYTWGWVGTVRDLSAGTDSPYQLQFSVGTDRPGMVITNVTVFGPGVPQTKLDPPSSGGTEWWTSCKISSGVAVGTIYEFTVDFANGSREIVYDKINTWITVAPAPSIVGTMLRWTNVSGSVPNADHYVVRGEPGQIELPLTQTSLDLSMFGWDGTGPTPQVEVGIVNENWDEAYRSNY